MTKQKLQTILDRIHELVPWRHFDLDYMSTGVRLEENGRHVSPRISKSQMEQWLNAFMQGIEAARNAYHNP